MDIPDNDTFWSVAAPLVAAGTAVEGTLMRQPCLRAAANDEFAAAAHYRDRGMVVKLPAADVADAIAAGIGNPFSIKTGSVFKEWLWVTLPSDQWLPWLEKAVAFAETKTKKPAKTKAKRKPKPAAQKPKPAAKKPKPAAQKPKPAANNTAKKPSAPAPSRNRGQRGGDAESGTRVRARSRNRT